MDYTKYRPLTNFRYVDRTWPDKNIIHAPIWCSTDLRDGNQALEMPMTLEQKLKYFQFLVDRGFKEIEIAFPSASKTEFDFVRILIEKHLIPDDVTIQVLTISRQDSIERTFESLKDVNQAIIHLYVATSPLHRNVVFSKNKSEIIQLVEYGAQKFLELAKYYGQDRFRFEFSPETFTSTEMDYVLDLCNHVIDIWKPTINRKAIINLPATVEVAGPNVYADQIEYMCKNLHEREKIIVSLHVHNDRGCGVAATELALMAGAERVEGTLFGNGERTGNVDLVTVALNLYTHGIDPKLDFKNIDEAVDFYKDLTKMPVHPRHPYAGELVYTAFSGTHQDAIKKGMAQINDAGNQWEMPYLPIDPRDVGRNYEAIIRINSQSGKSGVSHILEREYGFHIPKKIQSHFGSLVTKYADEQKHELTPKDVYNLFTKHI